VQWVVCLVLLPSVTLLEVSGFAQRARGGRLVCLDFLVLDGGGVVDVSIRLRNTNAIASTEPKNPLDCQTPTALLAAEQASYVPPFSLSVMDEGKQQQNANHSTGLPVMACLIWKCDTPTRGPGQQSRPN
jgi:hypothetical protein